MLQFVTPLLISLLVMSDLTVSTATTTATIQHSLVLRHVTVLFRHGDRNPIEILPRDRPENAPWTWPAGLGGLTRVGMRQHFRFGQWLSARYRQNASTPSSTDKIQFAPHYNYTEVFVRSSNNDRCLQSAQAHMAGFFSSSPEPYASLVPIHAHAQKNDDLIEQSHTCSKIRQIIDELHREPEIERRYAPFQCTLEYLQKSSGWGPDKLNFQTISYVQDSMYIERLKGRRWPTFMSDEIFANLTRLTRMNWRLKFTGTRELTRLIGGFLVSTILDNMREIMADRIPIHNEVERPSGSKLIIYSGHDTDVSAASAVLGNLIILPPYASGLIFELWQNKSLNSSSSSSITITTKYSSSHNSSSWAIRVAYRSHENETDPTYLKIPGCASVICPMHDFVRNINNYLAPIKDFDEICENKNNRVALNVRLTNKGGQRFQKLFQNTNSENAMTLLFIVVVLVCILLIIDLFFRIKRRNLKNSIPNKNIF